MNELILILSLVVIFGGVILAYRFFGKGGLYAFTVFATVLANIEVLILVRAFGMEQTLGNVLFASTYLITDILSENEGKKSAEKAVNIGVCTAVFMVIITQSWLLFTPSQGDWVSPSIKTVFSATPRLLFASFLGYAISQKLDVFLYHRWWAFTEKRTGNRRGFLWLRNNGSTLISQIVNTVVFNMAAFFGLYDGKTLLSVIVSSYIIYVVTSLLDTPVVYLARKMKEKGHISAEG